MSAFSAVISLLLGASLYIGLCVLMFYISYRIVRAGVRDGIKDYVREAKENLPSSFD